MRCQHNLHFWSKLGAASASGPDLEPCLLDALQVTANSHAFCKFFVIPPCGVCGLLAWPAACELKQVSQTCARGRAPNPGLCVLDRV